MSEGSDLLRRLGRAAAFGSVLPQIVGLQEALCDLRSLVEAAEAARGAERDAAYAEILANLTSRMRGTLGATARALIAEASGPAPVLRKGVADRDVVAS